MPSLSSSSSPKNDDHFEQRHQSTFNQAVERGAGERKRGGDAKLDALTQQTMQELMKTRGFKELWAELALKISTNVEENDGIDDERVESVKNGDQGGMAVGTGCPDWFPTTRFHAAHKFYHSQRRLAHPPDPVVAKCFQQLTQGLQLAIGTFLRGTQMAFSSEMGPNRPHHFNREAASFYSVRVQLDRFRASGHFRIAQFHLVARGLEKLERLFANYVSIPYPVENCSFLAITLLEMVAQFLEYSSLFESANKCEEEAHWFCQSIEQFEKKVCQRLDKMLLSLQKQQRDAQKCRRSSSAHLSGQLPMSSRSIPPPLMDVTVNNRQRVVLFPFHPNNGGRTSRRSSFLLAPELEYGRAKMAHFQKSRSKSEGGGGRRRQNGKRGI